MFKTPMYNSTIKKIAMLIILGALGMAGATAVARADGYITPGEEQIGDTLAVEMCAYINRGGVTTETMTTLYDAIYPLPAIADGGDVADVINYTVSTYCPSHWRELVSFGDAVRNAG